MSAVASAKAEATSNVIAAVMTGKGAGAISTIGVFGKKAETVIQKIFIPSKNNQSQLKTGRVLLGTINDGSEIIDQVTIGCEANNCYAINCHGNPLIVEMIMQLLSQNGVKLITAKELLIKTFCQQENLNTIKLESKLAQLKAATIEGTKIIANQVDFGLAKTAASWLENINDLQLDEIKTECEKILKATQTAKLIMYGCKIAIVGQPNTGKSTLLNCLCGRQKAIVTNVRGTTRDWISATCKIGSLSVELFDTAGLDEKLSVLEEAAQKETVNILRQADLVLFVLDGSESIEKIDKKILDEISGKLVLTVLNKSDLKFQLEIGKLPPVLNNTVKISAKLDTGIDELREKILKLAGTDNFDLRQAVCTTTRQENLLIRLTNAKSKDIGGAIITELLNAPLSV
ncbi:MAG: GTP-binding protein [Planctomycetes bacterium]|nr:GTP-binding protein [Planctomycetota bacterium]